MINKDYSLNKYSIIDIKIANTIIIHLYLLICKNMLVNTSDFFYEYNWIFNTVITVLFAFLYIFLFVSSNMIKYINTQIAFIILFLLSFIFLTYYIDPIRFSSDEFPYSYVKIQMRTFVAYSLPLFVVISYMGSVECLLKKLYDHTFIPFLIATVSFYFSLQPHENGVYMSYGNAVLFLSIILLFKFKNTKNIFTLIQFILTCIYIFISGSRGPLISIVVAVSCLIIIEKNSIYKWLLLFLSIFLGVILLLYFEEIIMFVANKLESFGIYSRTIRMILKENLFYDSERSEYHRALLERLNMQPVIGLGAYGGEATVGLAHSLYLDILANFGYIFGSLFIAYLVLNSVYKIYAWRNTAYSELILIMAVIILPRGFFDEAFWSAKEMWVILALFIKENAFENSKPFQYLSNSVGVTQDENINNCY